MGIDRWSDDAGMIAIASSLDSRKLSHKIVAWVMLVAITSSLQLGRPAAAARRRQGRVTSSRPRHISSVVPSPHTT